MSRSFVAAAFSLKNHEKDFSRRRRERRRLGHGFSRQCEKPQFEVRRSRTAAVGITHVSPFAKDFCERDKNIVRKQGFPAPAPRICANLRLGGKGECGDVKMKALRDRRRGKTSRSLVAAAISLKAHEKDFSRRRRERRRLGHGFSRQCEKPQFEVRRSRTAAVGITHVSPFAKDFCEFL